MIENIVSVIYRQSIAAVIMIAAASVVLWHLANRRLPRSYNAVLFALSAVGILLITVVLRTVNDSTVAVRSFSVMADYTNEFKRELVMNALLFLPIGLTLPYAIKSYGWAILIGFLVSASVEALQYAFAVGSSQVSDVVFNTLGVAFGGISYLLTKYTGKTKNETEKE